MRSAQSSLRLAVAYAAGACVEWLGEQLRKWAGEKLKKQWFPEDENDGDVS